MNCKLVKGGQIICDQNMVPAYLWMDLTTWRQQKRRTMSTLEPSLSILHFWETCCQAGFLMHLARLGSCPNA